MKNCLGCHKIFYPLKWELKRGNGKYCSRRCADIYQKGTPRERFEKFVKKTKTCWLWIGSKDPNGYGKMSYRNYPTNAHRMSWILNKGDIPDSKFILHKCDNPPCVNPDHLFVGTAKDNSTDMVRKGRHARFSNRGESCGSSKLRELDVSNIRKMKTMGISVSNIIKHYNISKSQIKRIINFQSWGIV